MSVAEALSRRSDTSLNAANVVLASRPLCRRLLPLHHGPGSPLDGAACTFGPTQTIHAIVTASLVSVLAATSSIWQHHGVPEVCYGSVPVPEARRESPFRVIPCAPDKTPAGNVGLAVDELLRQLD